MWTPPPARDPVVTHHQVILTDSGGATDSLSVDLAGPTSTLADAEARATWTAEDVTITGTLLPDGKTLLFGLWDGTGEALEMCFADEFMDAFVAFTIRLEDGPDPDAPNH